MPPTFVLSQDQTLQKFLLRPEGRLFVSSIFVVRRDSKDFDRSHLSSPATCVAGLPRPTWARGPSHAVQQRDPTPLKAICYQLVKDRACSEVLAVNSFESLAFA